MRRDTVAAGAADTGRGEAVVINVDWAPKAAAIDVYVALAVGLACRICHVNPDGGDTASGWEVIRLVCGCKDDLGHAHRHCAEAWFRIKGDRSCEICGSDAKNITGLEVKTFMEEWRGRRVANNRIVVERRGSTCWRQPLCCFLLGCLSISFMLPWFFHVNVFRFMLPQLGHFEYQLLN